MNDTRLIHRRKLRGTLGFYVGAVVFVIGLLWLNIYINGRKTTFFFAEPSADLAAAALNKAWDAYAATGSLLTGLATTLLAGLGLLLTSAPKPHDRPRELWPAKVSGLCAFLSLYFGYASSQNVAWAIEYSIPSLNIAKIQWPRILQFFALLAGVIFFADFVRRDLTRED